MDPVVEQLTNPQNFDFFKGFVSGCVAASGATYGFVMRTILPNKIKPFEERLALVEEENAKFKERLKQFEDLEAKLLDKFLKELEERKD